MAISKNSFVLQVTIPKDMLQEIDLECSSLGLSRSAFAKLCICEHFRQGQAMGLLQMFSQSDNMEQLLKLIQDSK